ncbi:MAG: DnaJ domain-containing protein [Deltaproteobacteria bacterium]|jgi:curved DNA-binding protein CbpA|nr:DnaJ domain-containing protein [Deltaproteobacteria bacterium]
MLSKAFKTLGLTRKATIDDIRKTYVKLARRYPPEHFTEKFAEIKSAYASLMLDKDKTNNILELFLSYNQYFELKSNLLFDMFDFPKTEPDLKSLEQLVDTSNLSPLLKTLQDFKVDPTSIEYRRSPPPNQNTSKNS